MHTWGSLTLYAYRLSALVKLDFAFLLLFPGSFASSGAWLFNKKVEYPENLKEAIQVKNTQPPSKEAEHPDSSGNGLIRDSDNRKHGNILSTIFF